MVTVKDFEKSEIGLEGQAIAWYYKAYKEFGEAFAFYRNDVKSQLGWVERYLQNCASDVKKIIEEAEKIEPSLIKSGRRLASSYEMNLIRIGKKNVLPQIQKLLQDLVVLTKLTSVPPANWATGQHTINRNPIAYTTGLSRKEIVTTVNDFKKLETELKAMLRFEQMAFKNT